MDRSHWGSNRGSTPRLLDFSRRLSSLLVAGRRAMKCGRYSGSAMYTVRQARTTDVRVIRALIDQNVGSGRLLDKHTVNLYEDIQEFCVATSSEDDAVVGCGALHVMWEDLAEIRTVAVAERARGH